MIKAIFYTRFHPEKGPRVLYQVPEGSIVTPSHPQPSSISQPIIDFPSISDLLIPRQEFCDRLVTVCANHYRVLGYPVCIENSRYYRNQFIFNLALVLESDADFTAHASVVRKLASLFRNLEEQGGFLSKEEEQVLRKPKPAFLQADSVNSPIRGHHDGPDEGGDIGAIGDLDEEAAMASLSNSIELGREVFQSTKVYAICEMIMEDLNNYCECMIPIDDANTINLKLFQPRPPPAPVYAWHVPLATVQLDSMSISSDLTLSRILPYIDGVASVAQIAQTADTDINLTRKAVAHLLHYRCVLLLDIFQFSAVYAPTAEIGAFIEDDDAQDEALRYVSVGHYRPLTEREKTTAGTNASSGPGSSFGGSSATPTSAAAAGSGQNGTSGGEQWAFQARESAIEKTTLLALYTSLRQGLTLRNWCIQHGILLAGVDVRRLITFGVIRGFLYRVHKYVIAGAGGTTGVGVGVRDYAATPSGGAGGSGQDLSPQNNTTPDQLTAPPTPSPPREEVAAAGPQARKGSIASLPPVPSSPYMADNVPLARYLDGTHCLDEVCTALQVGERKALERMKEVGLGDVVVVHR